MNSLFLADNKYYLNIVTNDDKFVGSKSFDNFSTEAVWLTLFNLRAASLYLLCYVKFKNSESVSCRHK